MALLIVALTYTFCILYLFFGKQIVNCLFTRFYVIVSWINLPSLLIVKTCKVMTSNASTRINKNARLVSQVSKVHYTRSNIMFLIAYFLAISVLAYFIVQNNNELYLLIIPFISIPIAIATRLLAKLNVIYSIALLLVSVYVTAMHGNQLIANQLSLLSYLMLLSGVIQLLIEYLRDKRLQLTSSTIRS